MATETKTCNICHEERELSYFATSFYKARKKTVIENRCRFCKNEAGRLLMREKAKKKKEANEAEIIDTVEEEVEAKPQLSDEQIARITLQRQKAKERYAKYKDTEQGKIQKEKNRLYKQENKDAINERRRAYLKIKMKDPLERMKRSMKTLLLAKIKKSCSSTTYFGTKMDDIRKWLEFNFVNGMDWENYGDYWHIDHTIAVDLWNLEDEDEKFMCFNWKNLIPLEKDANLKKATHLYTSRVFYQEQRLRLFFKENDISENLDGYLDKYSKKFKDLLPEFYMRHTSIAGSPL